ncbi:hypothetical protein Lbir_0379 [Legionella birminghamensis]|uniref:Low-complexity protein n=1 Tax=Legionella birminghamensis TaxID=28083 RepID=A0A378ICG1_9GAMM|nr:hypothetical protein [Legionella birminghamensis]KTC75467.1 hypothetical protein Lbir_0379 [Legionella birminghamensis]STX32693.1 Uncharacterised protein [Legionella birminghamensis]
MNKTIAVILGTGLGLTSTVSLAQAFQTTSLPQGYKNTLIADSSTPDDAQTTTNDGKDDKKGEGKCAAGKCGAGKCGSSS